MERPRNGGLAAFFAADCGDFVLLPAALLVPVHCALRQVRSHWLAQSAGLLDATATRPHAWVCPASASRAGPPPGHGLAACGPPRDKTGARTLRHRATALGAVLVLAVRQRSRRERAATVSAARSSSEFGLGITHKVTLVRTLSSLDWHPSNSPTF